MGGTIRVLIRYICIVSVPYLTYLTTLLMHGWRSSGVFVKVTISIWVLHMFIVGIDYVFLASKLKIDHSNPCVHKSMHPFVYELIEVLYDELDDVRFTTENLLSVVLPSSLCNLGPILMPG